MNRRDFLGTTAGTLLGAPYLRGGRDQLESIGLQLSTVHDTFARDPEGTLAGVAAVGYRDVELSELYGPPGCPAPRLRAALDRSGLVARAVHLPTPLLYRGLDRHADVAASLGCTYLVCSHIDPDERRALRDWHELAAMFNRAAETARRAGHGLRVAYHNHDYELARADGQVPYDILLAETDPALVWFELDARVGDPIAYLAAHRGRFFALHVGGDQTDTRLLAAARGAGVERYFVALDNPPSPSIDSARRAYASLRRLRW
jgi:sugar phosphate isomerase/epimerase